MMGKRRVNRFSGTTWADYVQQRALVFPPEWETWGDIPKDEARRLTRNWKRWRQRRLERQGEPLRFTLQGDTVMVEVV